MNDKEYMELSAHCTSYLHAAFADVIDRYQHANAGKSPAAPVTVYVEHFGTVTFTTHPVRRSIEKQEQAANAGKQEQTSEVAQPITDAPKATDKPVEPEKPTNGTTTHASTKSPEKAHKA